MATVASIIAHPPTREYGSRWRGALSIFAVLDWVSRRVLAWRLSNTLTTDFRLVELQEAISRYGTPTIFNTDQGCSSPARSSRGF